MEPTAQNPSDPMPMSTTPQPGGPLAGKTGVVLFLLLFGAAGALAYHTLTTAKTPDPEPIEEIFMCSVTPPPNNTFPYKLKLGEGWPVPSPFSGKKTGFPVERCFWTKDGKRKLTPTYVILNERLGKKDDTLCPDCGRLVVEHNPPPPSDIPVESNAAATANKSKPANQSTATAPAKAPPSKAR